MVHLILGNITFLDPQIDGEHKAIVHRIDKTLEFIDSDLAELNGEKYLDNFEAYLVPSSYKGDIEYLMDETF